MKLDAKHLTLALGVLFGVSIIFCVWFVIPCSLLIISSSIQLFEYSKKEKSRFEQILLERVTKYEEEMGNTRKDLETLKVRVNYFGMGK